MATVADKNAGTGLGLREFLTWAAGRGDLNPSTVNVLKAATASVLDVEDEPDSVDVRALDVDSILDRFTTLNRTRYAPASMKTYQSRFRTAVTLYKSYLDGDPNWKKTVKPRRSPEGGTRPGKSSRAEPNRDPTPTIGVTLADSGAGNDESQLLVTHNFPLRPNMIVQLRLPVDLTTADAARIAGFVKSLAFEAPADSPPAYAGTGIDLGRADGN